MIESGVGAFYLVAALMAAEGARCPHTPSRGGYAANGTSHLGHQATAAPVSPNGPNGRG